MGCIGGVREMDIRLEGVPGVGGACFHGGDRTRWPFTILRARKARKVKRTYPSRRKAISLTESIEFKGGIEAGVMFPRALPPSSVKLSVTTPNRSTTTSAHIPFYGSIV